MVIAAFDIGGSHISCGYFEDSTWRLLEDAGGLTSSLPTNEANSLQVLIALAEKAKLLYGSSLRGLSLSVPGPFDYARGVSQMRHKLVAWYGIDLRRLLSDASEVHEHDIAFINDADAFLHGALFAASIRTGRSLGITLGTGIGSSFADGSEILTGGDGVPAGGEIWNLPYGQDTVEDAISTRRLEGDYAARTGVRQTVNSIAEAAHSGELVALEVFREFGRDLAKVLERIAGTFDPERILLGGGISSAGDLFLPSVLANPWCAGRVSIASNRDIAPLVGAAVGARVRSKVDLLHSAGIGERLPGADTECSPGIPLR